MKPFASQFRFLRLAAARGIALFFGCFALLNVMGELRYPGFDANLWWIDLRVLPQSLVTALVCGFGVLLLIFSLQRSQVRWLRMITAAFAVFFAIAVLLNGIQFYVELARGTISSSFPVPLSLFIAAAFFGIARNAWQDSVIEDNRVRWIGIPVVFISCLVLFPILQVFCLGKTDYRRPADAIVVPGARAYADGRLSDALADRMRTAVELYKGGYAPKLIVSGGPGDGAIHETEAMRRFAVAHGVPNEDILVDEQGLNTRATVEHTLPMLQSLDAYDVLVVSHFYHLPRIRLTYARAGRDVFTVPAREAYFLTQTPYMILREVAGLWVYYLRPLQCDCY